MARGTQRPDSDVDVGVLSETLLDVEQRIELVDAAALAPSANRLQAEFISV